MQSKINLTDSVLSHKERMERDLISWLDEFVVGQNEAKRALVRVVIEWLFNIYRDQGVLWAVFLAWPTGVGKTELARSLARTLFWDPSAITKIVAETMPHQADIAQLIGSSAGYVGYGDTPEMADTRVHRWYRDAKEKGTLHPLLQWYEATDFSIVLVDEVEKAHPDIPNAFLWAIQSGEMKMASGKESDGKIKHSKVTDLGNTLIIFTSNTWEHKIAQETRSQIGFTTGNGNENTGNDTFIRELKRHFAPEFIGRMDAIIRCHTLSEDELRRVFDLHTARMNKLLDEKSYFSGLQVRTTQAYVDNIISGSRSIEYGARAIIPAIKAMWTDVGLAIQSGRIPKQGNGVLEFDMDSGSRKPTLKFLHTPSSNTRVSNMGTAIQMSILEDTRNLVEGKINRYGNQLRKTVQSYIRLIAWYDSGFADICSILESRLRWFGFNKKDIDDLQAIAFISIYQLVEQQAEYEIIVRYDEMFGTIWFRPIEKFLRTAILRSLPLEEIYHTIRVLLKRPMTREESIVISQYIHRILHSMSHR